MDLLMDEKLEEGDQIRQHKQAFWNSGMKTCYKCAGQDLAVTSNVLRMTSGGNNEGVDVFSCNNCSWVTSFEWSESETGRYTEPKAQGWRPSLVGYPMKWLLHWCQDRELKYLLHKVQSGALDGPKLMDLERRNKLQAELKLTEEQTKELEAALRSRNFKLSYNPVNLVRLS